jgi:hypothetical protein
MKDEKKFAEMENFFLLKNLSKIFWKIIFQFA